jgi:DNA-binding MarR family transcriptional regulator
MAQSEGKHALASEVWRRMFAFFISTRFQRDSVLQRLDLTPNDTRALGSLSQEEGRTMRSLAREWGCDASNATWMVDRLERKGLAERHSLPGDRRVKLVVLTPAGEDRRRQLAQMLADPPAALLQLEMDDLEALRCAVERLPLDDARLAAVFLQRD